MLGGNPYRAKAFLQAADNLSMISQPLGRIIAAGALTNIPGIGPAIADIVTKMHQTGSHPTLEKLRKEVPSGVLELFALPGLRPDKILKLYKELGITSLAELETAAKNDRIRNAKSLGPNLQTKILQNLSIANHADQPRLHLHKAKALLDHAVESLKRTHPQFSRVEVAGDFRRGCELISDLALVAEAKSEPAEAASSGASVTITDKKHFGAQMLHSTGSSAHIEGLRAFARGKGFDLQPNGLYRGKKLIAAATEEDIYKALGLQFIEPELREGRDEIKRAANEILPRLVEDHDLRGILHCHTTSSDGFETLATMAEATRVRGFEYFGVADHSQSAHYAGGLSVEEIADQRREVDRLNKNYGKSFRILQGIEADILGDGSLDYSDQILNHFDFVVASVHSGFKKPKKEQTERLIKAIRNPHTHILGHITGRQLLRRTGYELDIDEVLRACADCHVAVEINAHPWRLDLDWRWHERGLAHGCIFSINPDAHSIPELDHMHWGVEMARKGGISADRVLNAMPLAKLLRWFRAGGDRQR